MKTINSKHAKLIHRSCNARFATFALAAITMAGSALLGSPADAGTGSPAPTSALGSSSIHLISSAERLTISPAIVNFGTVNIGASLPETVTFTNKTTVSQIIKSQKTTGAGLSLSGLYLPLTLAAGKSSSFKATFRPLAEGTIAGSVVFTTNVAGASIAMSLVGTGSAVKFTANPASVTLGSVQLGATSLLKVTLTNSGNAEAHISAVSVTGSGFASSGVVVGQEIASGKAATLSVTFKPTALGVVTGKIVLTSASPAASITIVLSGTGIPVPAPKLTVSPASLSFGSVNDGSTTTLSASLTNTGTANLIISSIASTNSSYSMTGLSLPATVAPGKAASFSILFAPISAGALSGSLLIGSNASPATVALSGTGVALIKTLLANPSALAFASIDVGQNSSQSFTITNTGDASVIISAITASGPGFSENGVSFPLTIPQGQSSTVNIEFAPASGGVDSGAVSIISNASNYPTVALSGTGVALVKTLLVNPSALTFTNITVGQGSTQSVSITNSGNTTTTISALTASGAGFAITSAGLPLSLPAGQSATVNVIFTPLTAGSDSGSVSITSDASGYPTIALSGTAVATIQHLADLTWTASTGDVAGYNVYRGVQTGGPYTKVTTSLAGSTAYTDETVVAGATYFYITTAVDSLGNESLNSNESVAVIPTP